MPLDLLVPDLLSTSGNPSPLRELRLPALERWLARADVGRRAGATTSAFLAGAFALPSPPPVAAIALAGEGEARDGTWLRADPVHLRAEQDGLRLYPPDALDIDPAEAAMLLGTLGAHFAGDGLEFLAPAPDRWYLRVPQGESPRTVRLDEAVGRDVFGLLPAATAGLNWPSLLTEAQMLLAAHPVNESREAEGKPAVNSIWLWGEGARPSMLATPYARVCTDDAFARGLAVLSGARTAPVPADLASLETGEGPMSSSLVVLEGLGTAWRRGDAAQWSQAAQRLDANWFAPLADAVARFGSVRIILPAGRDTLVAGLTAAARWRWYRSRKPLADHA